MDKNEILFIGDSLIDIKAGKKAGVKTVLIKRYNEQELHKEADMIINSLEELLK